MTDINTPPHAHPKHLSHPKYRADIDGLRAIAVLAVVLFHAFPKAVIGGFVGVDIFFVISGFLISTIIFGNLERNSFSLIEFYSRRVRRIFPTLFVVLSASFVFGWFALLADEYEQLGKHIAGGAGFVSNLILWKESGYFDNAAETKPLLHLWSLGIEEQFYIAWPLFLMLAWRKHTNFLLITCALLLASFALNIAQSHTDPVADFYSPQTRFWELLSGSVLAYVTLHQDTLRAKLKGVAFFHQSETRLPRNSNSIVFNDTQSAVGGLLILIGIFGIKKDFIFPGYWAALPVLGAAILIAAGAQAWVNRVILSNRVLVWFGLISYPLYLWHWPLLSFARLIYGKTPDTNVRVSAVLIAIGLAWLTYTWIERPLRFGKNAKAKTIALLLALFFIACAGLSAFNNHGFPSRQNASATRLFDGDIGHLEFHKYPDSRYYRCTPAHLATDAPQWGGFIRCLQSKASENVDIALIGDSHAEHLFIGLAEQLQNKNIAFYIKDNVPFIDNADFKKIFAHVLSNKEIKKVIITMYWSRRSSKVPSGSTLEHELLRTADALIRSGKEVYIADGVPSFPFDPKNCAFDRVLAPSHRCTRDKENFENAALKHTQALETVFRSDPRIKRIETAKYFCGAQHCSMTKGDEILFRDNNHLNIIGSKYIGKMVTRDNPTLGQDE